MICVLLLAAGEALGVAGPRRPRGPPGRRRAQALRRRRRPARLGHQRPGRRRGASPSTPRASTPRASPTCAATRCARWRSRPRGAEDLDVREHAQRLGIAAVVGAGAARHAARGGDDASRTSPTRASAARRPLDAGPPPVPRTRRPGGRRVGPGRRPGSYDGRHQPGLRGRAARVGRRPGRPRPLRRRGRPAARRPRRGVRPAVGLAAGGGRASSRSASPRSAGPSATTSRSSPGCPRADRWREVRAAHVEQLLEQAARARRRRRRHRLQPRGRRRAPTSAAAPGATPSPWPPSSRPTRSSWSAPPTRSG